MDIKTAVDFVNPQSVNTFWQANFWGIVGTITGAAGLMVSWFSFKYNTPKIEVEKADLIIPDWITEDWKNKTVAELKSSVLEFELEIVVRNHRGGSGSIDKPILLIKIPNGKLLWFFPKYKYLQIKPVTEHFEMEKESDTTYKTWTERHGKSFNLAGGEKVDDKLTYRSLNAELIHEYIKEFSAAEYFIEHTNNSGKKYRKKIENLLNKTDQND